MLRLAGAELRLVPAKPYRDPDNYVHVSERVAKELAASEPNGALWANQWDNLANCRAHVEGTGPEIWLQTSGRIDGFTCAIGTGGTLAGISIALKDRNLRRLVNHRGNWSGAGDCQCRGGKSRQRVSHSGQRGAADSVRLTA